MDTEQKAASILLDRGVGWKVPAPWPLSIFKAQVMLVIKPLRLGALLELSRLYASMNIDPQEPNQDPHALIKCIPIASRIAAVCLLNSPLKIRLFSGMVARFVRKRLTADQLLEMMLFVVTYSGTASFTSIIRLMGEMKMTTPNLSHQEQGS